MMTFRSRASEESWELYRRIPRNAQRAQQPSFRSTVAIITILYQSAGYARRASGIPAIAWDGSDWGPRNGGPAQDIDAISPALIDAPGFRSKPQSAYAFAPRRRDITPIPPKTVRKRTTDPGSGTVAAPASDTLYPTSPDT